MSDPTAPIAAKVHHGSIGVTSGRPLDPRGTTSAIGYLNKRVNQVNSDVTITHNNVTIRELDNRTLMI